MACSSPPSSTSKSLDEEGEEEGEVRWLKYYSSAQEILLVGDGDFSFSLSLAAAFLRTGNITATSLDPFDVVIKKYEKAKSNLEALEKMGATLLYGVDATKMKLHTDLKMRKFDRIIFNFPHAGFKGKEDNLRLINLHRKLVHGFFRNANRMLRPNGEVHISHKTGFPFRNWNLEELAAKNSLKLKRCFDFKIEDYPGYNNKRGDGSRCDQPFPLGECSTYMFTIGNVHRKKKASGYKMDIASAVSLFESSEIYGDSRVLTRNILPLSTQRRVHSPTRIGISSGPMRTFYNRPEDDCVLLESIRRRVNLPSMIGRSNVPIRIFPNRWEDNHNLPEVIERRVHSVPRHGIGSASMSIFGTQLEANQSLLESMRRRAYSPPRIGICSTPMGVYGPENFLGRVHYPPSIGIGSQVSQPRVLEHKFIDGYSLFRKDVPELIHFNARYPQTNYQGYMNKAPGSINGGYFAAQTQGHQYHYNLSLERSPGMLLAQAQEGDATRYREMGRGFGHPFL